MEHLDVQKAAFLHVACGTELNRGPAEDTDSIVVSDPNGVDVSLVGEGPGALVVSLFGDVYYYHQPERVEVEVSSTT